MIKAAIYTRFSSNHQTEDSIKAQKRACQEYADSHGLTIVSFYADEAVSAKNDRRPEFQRMIRDAEKGNFSVVLVHKYNRFARRMTDHVKYEERLNRSGVELIAVAENFGTGKEAIIMKALMRSLSEYYLEDLAQETRKGLREVALKGLHAGGYPPFGYDVADKHYVVNDLEAGYVRKIFDAAQARSGFAELIEEMDRQGIRGKRGKPIRYPQIYEMLRNEKYTGVYLYSTTEAPIRADRRQKPDAVRIENALPIIISKEQFEEVQRIMDERKQTGRKADYMCSGLVYCWCGAKMHGMTSRRKGHEYRYFVCSAKCGAPVLHMEEVDAAAMQYLKELLSDEMQLQIADRLRQYQAGAGSRMTEFKQALKKRIAEKQAQYNALMNNLASGALPAETVADIGARMQEIKAEIAALEATEPPKDFTVDTIRAWLESMKAAPDRDAVRLLVERINVSATEEDDGNKQKTAFNIQSTLNTVLRKNGCGETQHCFPKILFGCYIPSV